MDIRERLQQSIDAQHDRVRREIPPDCTSALLAILRAQNDLSPLSAVDPVPDLITGHRITNPGGNKALWLLLDAADDRYLAATEVPGAAFDGWAERFLGECGELAAAELVMAHVKSRFMRLVNDGESLLNAWISTRQAPATWRERADVGWWASWMAKTHEPALRASRDHIARNAGDIDAYSRLASVYVKMMDHQLAYAPEVIIGSLRVGTWLDILTGLIAWALEEHDRLGQASPLAEDMLTGILARRLAIPPDIVRDALSMFTLDRHNAAWHAVVPGVAAAPLIRLKGDRLIPSIYGLTTEPLLFLSRELRRRDPQVYHIAAQYREEAFRQNLYAIFDDKRFVRSDGTIRLRRGKGDLHTDIDAVVFDRKTGSLGVFELKSHDPFARSTAALARQRDNVLYANRQLSGMLDWIRAHGADDLLNRVDAQTAKRFRANKVYPFVLGRYLARFSDGAQPDDRAAWGTWPQVLRLLDDQPLRPTDGAPIASLFNRLKKDAPGILPPADAPSRTINLGDIRLVVHASYASYQSQESR